MSDMPFGKMFKRLSEINNQFQAIDAKLAKFETNAKSYADRAQTVSENLIKKGNQSLNKLDAATKQMSDKLEPKPPPEQE